MLVATPSPARKAEVTIPLLPPLLSGPSANLWLWALPLAVLLALNLQGYWLIGGNMDAAQRTSALVLGFAGVANFLGGLISFTLAQRAQAHDAPPRWWWPLPSAVAQIAYLWLAVSQVDTLIPASVAIWIYPPTRFLFNQFAFAMLPLALSVIRLACTIPVLGPRRALTTSAVLVVSAPVLLYVGFELLDWIGHEGSFAVILVGGGIALFGVALFVGLIRGLMLGLRSIRAAGQRAERWAIAVFALVLPLAGLALNRSLPFPVDFQAWEVYALTIANAGILLLASWKHAAWPRLSFAVLSGMLPFSLYFFIVFLPYTPLSIIAMIAFGAGFLVLTPTLLFFLHIHLWNHARHDAAHRRHAMAIGVGSFLVLPLLLTARGLADKAALNSALDYVFAPPIAAGDIVSDVNRANLQRALASYRSYKEGIYYPLLSDYYAWLVFDNLVLPDDKLARLERVFFGPQNEAAENHGAHLRAGLMSGDRSTRRSLRMPRAVPPPQTVTIDRTQLGAVASGDTNAVVTLALTLRNTGVAPAEFVQQLPLPPGVFVNGFRLHINGVAVPGRVFEKKTALWVYAMIRDSQRRDPGLLVYRGAHDLELRVFPLEPKKPTRVEIDFLVPARPDTFDRLATDADPIAALREIGTRIEPVVVRTNHGTYFATNASTAPLPSVDRAPYLHVLVDRSTANGFEGDLHEALGRLQARFPDATLARVSLVSFNVVDLEPSLVGISTLRANKPATAYRALPKVGGCVMDFAIAHALRQHIEHDLNAAPNDGIPPRPVIVILSHNATVRTLDEDLISAWCVGATSFELHELGEDGGFLTPRQPPIKPLPMLRCGAAVRTFAANDAVRFLPTTLNDRVEYWAPDRRRWVAITGVVEEPDASAWGRAATLQLEQQDFTRSPGAANRGLAALVATSRDSGILIPSTSYIVVENSAQWRMLEVSENQKLGQNVALEFRETPAPPAVWIAMGFVSYVVVLRYVRRRRAKRASAAISVRLSPA